MFLEQKTESEQAFFPEGGKAVCGADWDRGVTPTEPAPLHNVTLLPCMSQAGIYSLLFEVRPACNTESASVALCKSQGLRLKGTCGFGLPRPSGSLVIAMQCREQASFLGWIWAIFASCLGWKKSARSSLLPPSPLSTPLFFLKLFHQIFYHSRKLLLDLLPVFLIDW